MRIPTLLIVLVLAACGKSEQQKQAEQAVAQMQQAGKQLGDAIASATAGVAVGNAAAAVGLGTVKAAEAVDFRELKALLPEDLSGMKRTNIEGQKNGAMGFTVSTAEARYEADGSDIKLTLSDIGAVAGVAAIGMYAWATAEIDKENETGYEKTTMLKGYRAYEKYDRSSKSGDVSLLVAGRFIVEAEGSGVTMDALKAALDKVDLGKLEGMKKVGVQ